VHRPEFFLLQCGADSIAGDPITHLQYSPAAHRHAARRLCQLAEEHARGRVLAMGGGGYNRDNLAQAWTAVLEALVEA
jgi:acetoin utilization protein AcuC